MDVREYEVWLTQSDVDET